MKYSKHMLKLWRLAGDIATTAESDKRYCRVYEKLSEALDAAEILGLITDNQETKS